MDKAVINTLGEKEKDGVDFWEYMTMSISTDIIAAHRYAAATKTEVSEEEVYLVYNFCTTLQPLLAKKANTKNITHDIEYV